MTSHDQPDPSILVTGFLAGQCEHGRDRLSCRDCYEANTGAFAPRSSPNGSSTAVQPPAQPQREGSPATRTPDEQRPPPLDDVEPRDQPEPTPLSEVQTRTDLLRMRLLTATGLQKIPPPTYVVDGWLTSDSLAWLGGKPGHGKTFLAVDLALCVATGTPWHGHATTPGLVLYVIAEGATGLARRVDAWSIANGEPLPDRDRLQFLPVAVQLSDALDGGAMAALLHDLAPVLVVVDTQARVSVGLDENSSKDMGRFVEALEQLRRMSGSCVLLLHHEPRSGDNLRGSTALEGAATTILRTAKDGDLVTVTCTKQKDAEPPSPLALGLMPLAGSAYLSRFGSGLASHTTGSEDVVLATLRDSFGTHGASRTELKEACDMKKSTLYTSVTSLVRRGLLIEEKVGRSTRYTLAADNQQPEIPDSPDESR